jgi:hypothetical protein
MLDMSWKWKLGDKRTQGKYIEKGLVDKSKLEAQLKALPDESANATWVEIDMEEVHVDDVTETSDEEGTP